MLLDTEVDLAAVSKVAGIEITDDIVKDICNAKDDVLILHLTSCHKVTDLGLASIGRHWKNLEKVIIADCPLMTHVGLRCLALNCRNLRTISFDDMDDPGLRIVAANLIRLEHIDLAGCRNVTDRGLSEIAHCCRQLKTLNLNGCNKIGESGIWGLCELAHCQKLEEIDLSGCTYLSDKGLWAVAKRCPALKKIHVKNCPYLSARVVGKMLAITPELVDVAFSESCKEWDSGSIEVILDSCKERIQRLDLSYCQNLQKKEVELICECSKLVELKLSGCQIRDEDILMITKNLPGLVSIELFGCDISEKSVIALAPKEGGVGLSYLGLTGCQLINPLFMKRMTTKYVYSSFIDDENFFGYQPLASEFDLRRNNRTTYQRLLASTKIQQMVRGMLVRIGIYREISDKLSVERGVPKLQAHFRRKKQIAITKILLHERKERMAAERIQLALQNYRWYQCSQMRMKEHQIRKMKTKVTIVIQRFYRGHLGRILASDCRYLMEMSIYKEKELNATRHQAAIDIQRIARRMIETNRVQTLRNDRNAKIRLRHKKLVSAVILQSAFRAMIGRIETQKIRTNIAHEEKRCLKARHIQCAWKCFKARRALAQLQYFKQIEIHQEKAVILQKMWRSTLAREHVRFLKALRDLMERELYSSTTIQRLYRGMRGRKKASTVRSSVKQKQRQNKAVNDIQRVYRGFIGKRLAVKALKLKSVEWKIQPLREEGLKLDAEINDCTVISQTLKNNLAIKESQMKGFKKEFAFVSKSKKEFVDSSVVNGILQRCARTLVLSKLTQEISALQEETEKLQLDQENTSEKRRHLKRERRELLHKIDKMTIQAITSS